jgi:NAD+ kinase
MDAPQLTGGGTGAGGAEGTRTAEPFRLATGEGSGPVGVLVTPSGDCAPQLLQIEAWARELGLATLDLGTSAQPNELHSACELVIALGGDGTILRALQLAMPSHAAVLGVNFGTVGFLADVDRAELAAALDTLARGAATVEARTALVARMHDDPDQPAIAFNDVVIARRPGFGTSRLTVAIGGEPLLSLNGDGVVVASPMGSTAYTVGAGGPAVAPTLDAIVITPLATQGSPLRSLVVDGDDSVSIEIRPTSSPVSVEVDGRTTHEMPAAARIDIKAAPRKARLVRTRPRTFYGDLARRI